MLRHLLESCEAVFDRIVVVVGPDMDAVRRAAAPHASVVQTERLGTAHAALQAVPQFGDGDVAVLYADNPLIRPETLRLLLARRAGGGAALALLAFRPADPGALRPGDRRHDGVVERIVEWADATPEQRRRNPVQRRRAVRLCRRHAALAAPKCAPTMPRASTI